MTAPPFWSEADEALLRSCYATANLDDLAFMLGRSVRALGLQARKLGVKRATNAGRIQPGSVPWNKGKKLGAEWGGEAAKATRFKPGQLPQTTLPVGTLRITKDGTLQRKIRNARGNNSARWRSVHELVWIAVHGPVPRGHIVVFKPGMATAIEAAITLDKVECISWAENMQRNSRHRLPEPLQKVIIAKATLTRAINKRERAEREQREFMEQFDIKYEPGWHGAFTRQQAPGALPNGARIVKTNSEPNDARPDGTPGVVLGSMSHPEVMDGAIFYFIEWANAPREACGVMGFKVRKAEV